MRGADHDYCVEVGVCTVQVSCVDAVSVAMYCSEFWPVFFFFFC